MLEIEVIRGAGAAESSLDPIRRRLLAALVEPASATTLAARVGLPRQKVNYHLRTLEQHGLVSLVAERRKGNMTERVMQATASSYVILPSALGEIAPDASRGADRLSVRWMLAVAARLIQDVGTLLLRSTSADAPLATLTIDSEVSFASAADRAEFAEELTRCVAALAQRFDAPGERGARPHRLVVALHPSITPAGTELHLAGLGDAERSRQIDREGE